MPVFRENKKKKTLHFKLKCFFHLKELYMHRKKQTNRISLSLRNLKYLLSFFSSSLNE
jgi:hypothetical protein